MLFQFGKILCFHARVRKVERTRITNAFIERTGSEACGDTKRLGSVCFPNVSAALDVLTAYLMRILTFHPYI